MATDAHGGEFVPTGPTHDLGYEPDRFAVKTILVVPGVVLATILVVYVITTLIFGAYFGPRNTPAPVSEMGAVRNGAPINERLDRISTDNPNAEVLQPRLEGLKKRESLPKDGNPKNTDPSNVISPEMISSQPLKQGNPPQYHADDLRPDRVPAVSTEHKDPRTGAVRSIPVDRAIDLVSDPKNAAWAKALTVQPKPTDYDADAWDRPKESNGGNAHWPRPVAPAPPKKAGGPEAKQPEKKGGATEKEPDKKEPDPKKK